MTQMIFFAFLKEISNKVNQQYNKLALKFFRFVGDLNTKLRDKE